MEDWTLIDGAYAFDGGTIVLTLVERSGQTHQLELSQHRIPQRLGKKPLGRLYWDSTLVPLHSQLEESIVGLLARAKVQPRERERQPRAERIAGPENRLVLGADIERVLEADTPEAWISHLQGELLEYVRSPKYGTGERG